MSYYSIVEVYIVETNKKLEEIISESNKIFPLKNLNIKINKKGKKILHFCDELTWLEVFPIVKYWKNLLSKQSEENFVFIRYGEEADDFEVEGSLYEAYRLRRYEIETDDFISERTKQILDFFIKKIKEYNLDIEEENIKHYIQQIIEATDVDLIYFEGNWCIADNETNEVIIDQDVFELMINKEEQNGLDITKNK